MSLALKDLMEWLAVLQFLSVISNKTITSHSHHLTHVGEAQECSIHMLDHLGYTVFTTSMWASTACDQITEQFASTSLVVLFINIDQQFNSLMAHCLF